MLMDADLLEMAGTLVAAVLTLFVFSYLLGDNVLYRLAEHIFVGVALGYAVVVGFHTVLASKLFIPMVGALGARDWEQVLLLTIPLVLGLLLLTKPSKTLSWLGNLSVAVLLGVGSALAIGGALLGTLLPQIDATADVTQYVADYGPGLGLFSGVVALVGTTGVLLHFYFASAQEGRPAVFRAGLVRTWGGLGRWFIVIAFGAILATTFVSRISLLIGRIQFLLETARSLLGG
jgi:hypothetical protein